MRIEKYSLGKGLQACAWGIALVVALACLNAANAQSRAPTSKLDVDSLCDLVEKLRVVELKYELDPESSPVRKLHPYAVGYTPSQNILLFGFQFSGYSQSAKSDSAKGWRNFRTDKIRTLVALDSTFTPVRPQLPNLKIIAEYACKNKLAQ